VSGRTGQVRSCVGCGAELGVADRFCEECGLRQADAADHAELDLTLVAGVTDRGLKHQRNEDAMAMRVLPDGTVLAVVCDGVSTAEASDLAAQLGSATGVDVLAAELAAGADPEAATGTAAAAAQKAVTALAEQVATAPACTYISAVITPGAEVAVGWLGDSRIYWLAEDWPRSDYLTVDDSWAMDVISAGLLSYAEAAADPRAHALTGWLGADAADDQGVARTATLRPAGPGTVLLCTDGLWNYQADPAGLAALLGTGSPLDIAKRLVAYAVACGGEDNVTAVVVPIPPDPARRTPS
jgi:serine/threonine protein phosphatase PrpC